MERTGIVPMLQETIRRNEDNQKSYYVGNAILQILWAGSGLE
nr:MAG TPA: hypothetical protein [Caudoviricetes sp.]